MSNVSDYRRNLAWKAGVRAHERGKSRETCNRQPGTIYADDWYDGYSQAEQGRRS